MGVFRLKLATDYTNFHGLDTLQYKCVVKTFFSHKSVKIRVICGSIKFFTQQAKTNS